MSSTFGSGKPTWSGFLLYGAIASLPVVVMGSVKFLRQPDALPVLGEVGEFSLTERGGATVTDRSLHNHIWIADFIFTNCGGPCPLMTAKMADLQDDLAAARGVKLVSFTVDPERDTPKVLSAYADKFQADGDRWLFLTGPMSRIRTLAVERFKLGSVDNPIFHSTRFVLVDGKGRIRGYYDSETEGCTEKIIADVLRLQQESRP